MSRRGPWDPRCAPHLSNPAAKRHKSAAALADSGRLLHMLYVLLQIITPSIYVPRDAMQRDVLGSEWGAGGVHVPVSCSTRPRNFSTSD